MRKVFTSTIVVAQLVFLSTFAAAQKTITIETGRLEGAVSDGVVSFKGVPYAAAPVGNLRWRPPQPAAKWSGLRSATAYGHDCMQLPFPSDAAPLGTTPAEDCLVVNVWVPEHRAAIESGGGRALMPSTGLHEGRAGRASAEEIGEAFAKKNGITGDNSEALKKLRALPADKIVDGLNMASMGPTADTYSGPMIDGKVVTDTPQNLYTEGKYQHVPMIVGANSMDIGFNRARNADELFAQFGPDAAAAKTAYEADGSENLAALTRKVAADRMMIEPARFVAQTLSSHGDPVWEYRFAYVATSMRSQWPGAPHATEIPFVFDTVKAKYGSQLSAEDGSIARQTNEYWANFTKTGNPNGSDLPNWPQYSNKDELLLIQPGGPVAEADPWKTRLDLTQKLAEDKAKSNARAAN